jgi:hypothetical protein
MCIVYMELNLVQKPGLEVLEFEKMWWNQNQTIQILEEPSSNPYPKNHHINFKMLKLDWSSFKKEKLNNDGYNPHPTN